MKATAAKLLEILNDGVEFGIATLDELPNVMGRVRQPLEKQLANGTDFG